MSTKPTADIDRRFTFAAGAVAELERRAEGEGDDEFPNIAGYAAVFYRAEDPGTQYDLFGDGTYVERIMPGAFDRAIREDDVVGVFNHNPDHLLGRTTAKTLRLTVDERGLRYWINPPETQLGKQVTMSIERGDLTGSSFAFVITDQTFREEDSGRILIREITGVRLYDVGPVTFPAYAATSTGLSDRCKQELAEFRSRIAGRPAGAPQRQPASPSAGTRSPVSVRSSKRTQGSQAMTTEVVKDLLHERGTIEHRLKELMGRADNENRDLNGEENTEWESLVSRDNELRSRIERHERIAETTRQLDQPANDDPAERRNRPASRVGALRDEELGGNRRREGADEELRALAFQSWFLNECRMEVSTRHRDACRRLDFRFDSKELIAGIAPTHEIRRLQEQYRVLHPSLIKRDMNLTGAAEFVPQGFVNSFEQTLLAVGGMLQVIDTIRTEGGGDLPWPTVDDTGNEGAILGEETDYGASVDPTISSVTLQAYKFSSKPVLISREVIEDSAFGVADLLGVLLGERIGRHLNRKLTVGTGTNEPQGVITAATVGETAASATAIAADELIDLYHSVDPAYRGSPSIRFMMNDSIVAHIRKLKDSDNQYLWQPGLQAGVPDRLLGAPVTINQHMVSTLAVNAKPVAFGDFSKYKARVVRGLRMRHLVELYAATDQEAFVAFLRADGDLLNSGAIKVLQMAAA